MRFKSLSHSRIESIECRNNKIGPRLQPEVIPTPGCRPIHKIVLPMFEPSSYNCDNDPVNFEERINSKDRGRKDKLVMDEILQKKKVDKGNSIHSQAREH
eukprot:c34916_g1_i1 orf=613-912(-)